MGISERKAREKRQKREMIVGAAKEEFLEFGVEGATMESIAKRVEISKASIYLHFKDKESLMTSILEEAFGCLRIEVFEKTSSENLHGIKRMRQLFDAYIRFCEEYPNEFYFTHFADHFLGSMGEGSMDNPLFPMVKALVDEVKDNLEYGIKNGEIEPEIDVKKRAVVIVHLVSSFMQRMSKAGCKLEEFHGFPQKELIEEVFQFLVQAMLKKTDPELSEVSNLH